MRPLTTMSLRKSVRCFQLLSALCIALLCSCGPAKDIIYIQDLPTNVPIDLQHDGDLRLQPGDRLNVYVHSRDPEMWQVFNLNGGGSSSSNMGSSDSYYTVDDHGRIDMPIIGQIEVEGLTRLEVAQRVKYRLLSGSLLRDPVVTVTFPDMAFYVIGESGVGRHEITTDRINLLEAISLSGDLPMTGKRTNVMVLRTEGDTQIAYRVNLTSTDDVYSSPVYYIRQNDMIYVEPTQVKQNTSTAHGSNYLTIGFWTSMVSLAATLAVLFTK